jgi:hypothetical protein
VLSALPLWIFFSFFIGFASDLVADVLAPVKNPRDPEQMVANRRVAHAASLASPAVLYSQAPRPSWIPTGAPAATWC